MTNIASNRLTYNSDNKHRFRTDYRYIQGNNRLLVLIGAINFNFKRVTVFYV